MAKISRNLTVLQIILALGILAILSNASVESQPVLVSQNTFVQDAGNRGAEEVVATKQNLFEAASDTDNSFVTVNNQLQTENTEVFIQSNSLAQNQDNAISAFNLMKDISKPIEERIVAAFNLIALLENGLLDYDANFVVQYGSDIITKLCNFSIDNRDSPNLSERTAALFEKLYLTAIFEDIAQEANTQLIDMKSEGIELPEFFTYSPSEFNMHEFSDYDRAIIANASSKVLQENLYSHIQNMQDLKNDAIGLSYPFFNDASGQYIYNYLYNLVGIEDTKFVEYHDSTLDAEMRPIRNIVATIPGTTHPEKKIVLTAHYDSMVGYRKVDKIAPGAEDNASGVAVLLEIARILQQEVVPLEYTVEIVLFDYEELDLNGSQAYIRHAIINENEIIGAFNFDMIGCDGGDGLLELITNPESGAFLNDVVFPISEINHNEDYVVPIIGTINDLAGSGDYSSFWGIDLNDGTYLGRGSYYAINVTAAWQLEPEYEFSHTSGDTVDNINFNFLENVAKWGVAAVCGLANPADQKQ